MLRNYILKPLVASLLTVALSVTINAAGYSSSSVLSQGRWVKIHIDSTSVYRLDFETLRSYGFSNPEKVTVHGYGSVERAHQLATAPDDLPQVRSTIIGDAIYFFGEGDRRIQVLDPSPGTGSNNFSYTYFTNYYSNGSYYFLTEDAGERSEIPSEVFVEAPYYEDTHTHLDLRTPHEWNVHSSSVYFFTRDIANKLEGYNFDFQATDYASDGGVLYQYAYYHTQSDLQYLNMTFSGDVTPSKFELYGVKRNDDSNTIFSRSVIKKIVVTPERDKSFAMTFSARNGCTFRYLMLSEVSFIYSRYNYLRGDSRLLRYSPSHNRSVRIFDKSDNLKVWDVSRPRTPRQFSIGRDDNGFALINVKPLDADSALTLCAFLPGVNIPSPKFEEEIVCRNLHSFDGIDYLIVTTDEHLEEAQRLAQAHREYQGLNVEVVTQKEVFNEFSSGAPHPNGLRKFINMLVERPSSRLKYVLLMGKGTYDPKNTSNENDPEYLVAYMCEDRSKSYTNSYDGDSDIYFAITKDEYAFYPPNSDEELKVSVARAPILGKEEAENFVNKSIRYLSDPTIAGRIDKAVISTMTGEEDTHHNSSEKLISDIKAEIGGVTIYRIYDSLHGDKTIEYFKETISENSLFINYSGHSFFNQIGNYIYTGDIDRLKFGSYPIMYMASCNTVPISSENRGFGTKLFLKPDGPIAIIGSPREVYITNNQVLNEEFVRQLYSSGNKAPRIGDAWRHALNEASMTGAQRSNNFGYHFMTDPALPIRKSVGEVKVADIDGQINALSPFTINGNILDSDGKIDANFNGTLTLSLYDAPVEVSRVDTPAEGNPKTLTIDETLLHELSVKIENGTWEATITSPNPSVEGPHRISFYACSDEGKISTGYLDGVSISKNLQSQLSDVTAPEITLLLDSEERLENDPVGASPVLIARIYDEESGLSINSSVPGGAIKVVLDDINSFSEKAVRLLTFNEDGSASLRLPLQELKDGRHNISLTASDVAGNTASKTLSFVVVSGEIQAELNTDVEIARESLTFSLAHSLEAQPQGKLIIRDKLGNTVFTTENVNFPYDYDLRGSNGTLLPDGRYRAYVILKSHPLRGSTPEVSFTVAKPIAAK